MPNENVNNYKNVIFILKIFAIQLIFSIIFVFIFSLAMYFCNIDFEFSSLFATLAIGIGLFASSFYAAKKIRKKGFLIGLLNGSIIFLIIMLISLFIDKGSMTFNTLFHFVIFVLFSLIGGILCVNKAQNKNYI